jgi:hypothetical protein
MSTGPETYKANTCFNRRRECEEDVDGWLEPFRPLFSATLGLFWAMYLLSKYGKNGSGSVAGLELNGEWMCEKILRCPFSVRV